MSSRSSSPATPDEAQPPVPYRIGRLARDAGVTSRVVRQYHASGLVPEPPRDPAGHRVYRPADLDLLLEIGRLRALGVPLDQVAGHLAGMPAHQALDLPTPRVHAAQPVPVAADDKGDGGRLTDG